MSLTLNLHIRLAATVALLILSPIVPLFSQESQSGTGVSPQVPLQKFQKLNGIGFRLPESLEIEMVAGAPLVQWPIVGEWDEKGRLVLVESAGVQANVAEQAKTKPHRMIRLADDNGDGVFDRRIVAAENLGFPEGVLCLGNQILVSTPPQIISLFDRDGDGICEDRSVWFDGTTLTGCANDLHGPYLGRDGWIYWCKGAFAEQKHALTSGKELVSKAAHIFRRRLAGGPIEAVMTGGMDNPVELAITPEGERFFTSTFLQVPGGGRRDGIAHAVYGGVYGKEHPAVLNGHLRTGPLMPIMTHLGPAAPSGLICLSSSNLCSDSGFFTSTGNTLAAAQFNLQRVSLHRLQNAGSTFQTLNQDLLIGDRVDFHPTDVIEDADGSLIVVDTGGWYDLCCPSSGVDQDRALGGIYRIKGKSSKATVDARGEESLTAMSNDSLAGLLGDSRWWLRKKVAHELALRKDPMPSLSKIIADRNRPAAERQEALWTSCRVGGEGLKLVIASSLEDGDPSIRQTAVHIASVERLPLAKEMESLVANEPSPQVRRAAAEALGRIGSADSVGPIMKGVARSEGDPVLDHSLIYALIELNQPSLVAPYLHAKSTRQQRAAVVVLDQSKSDLLKASEVFSFMRSNDSLLHGTALETLGHHPEWSEGLAKQLKELCQASQENAQEKGPWLAIVEAWRERPEVKNQVERLLQPASSASEGAQEFAIESLQRLKLKDLPLEWSPSVVNWLAKASDPNKVQIANWLMGLRFKQDQHPLLVTQLQELASKSETKGTQALQFLAAMPEDATGIPVALQSRVLESLTSEQTEESTRGLASKSLQRLRLDHAIAEQLMGQLGKVAPLHLLSAITAINRLNEDPMDERMFDSLKSVPSVRALPPDGITSLYRSRSPALKEAAKRVVDSINQPPVEIAQKLSQIEADLPAGDPVRGFQVFRSPKGACSACHRVGYVGGDIGPELSRIGGSRTRRDLLEAILFPSVRLAASYQPIRVLTSDGQVHNGLVRSESENELEIVVTADRNVRIPRSEIESRQASNVSIMPAGLDQTMTIQDLADLLVLLESKK